MVQMQPLFLYVRGEGFAANAGQEEAAVLGHKNAKASFSKRRRKTPEREGCALLLGDWTPFSHVIVEELDRCHYWERASTGFHSWVQS